MKIRSQGEGKNSSEESIYKTKGHCNGIILCKVGYAR
jgi:hypothetical protein